MTGHDISQGLHSENAPYIVPEKRDPFVLSSWGLLLMCAPRAPSHPEIGRPRAEVTCRWKVSRAVSKLSFYNDLHLGPQECPKVSKENNGCQGA